MGARAFARLAALRILELSDNAITWMAPTSLDGLTRLERLYLSENRLGAFDYGALAPMAALEILALNDQEGGDLRCGGKDRWHPNAVGIAAARGHRGGDGSPCACLLYTSPSPRDGLLSRMPSSA